MSNIVSSIQNQDLKIPKINLEAVRQFSMTRRQDEGEKNRDTSPFNRYVDIWWAAMCIGIQESKRTSLKPDAWHVFIRAGEVLPSNPWRMFQLQLLGVGITGSTEILSRPAELINLANEYAATGLPILLDQMIGQNIPIWKVTSLFENRIKNEPKE